MLIWAEEVLQFGHHLLHAILKLLLVLLDILEKLLLQLLFSLHHLEDLSFPLQPLQNLVSLGFEFLLCLIVSEPVLLLDFKGQLVFSLLLLLDLHLHQEQPVLLVLVRFFVLQCHSLYSWLLDRFIRADLLLLCLNTFRLQPNSSDLVSVNASLLLLSQL